MTVTLHLYEADGTLVRNLTTAIRVGWREREREDGRGWATFKFGDPALADLRVPDRIVRVRVDGVDEFGWLTRKGSRILAGKAEQVGGEVMVSGAGTRALLSAARIYPTTTCPLGEDLREVTFGVPHPDYDTTGLANAVSFGTWKSQPFATLRPDNAPDVDAELITISTDAQPEMTYYLVSPEFTVPESKTYAWCVSADDEYDSWMHGMVVGQSRGPFKWKQFDVYNLFMCTSDTYRAVLKIHNLDRLAADSNFTWAYATLVETAGDGKPAATNTIVHVNTTSTGGTFTLSVNGTSTGGLAYDITSTNLQTALEQIVGAGNVTVSGSGVPARNHQIEVHNSADTGTFQLLFDGQATGNIAYNASAATVKAAIEALGNVTTVTVTGVGNSGDPWVITVTDPANTSFTVTSNDSLTAGGSPTSTSISVVHAGTEADPWIIEFVGTYSGTPVTMGGSGATLDDGELTVSPQVEGASAVGIIHTDTDWLVVEVPASGAGMNFGEMFDAALAAAQGRGPTKLDHVTTNWTQAADSNGVGWGFEYELTFTVEKDSLLDMLKQGEADGYDTRMGPTLALDVMDERGVDRTATVTLSKPGSGTKWDWDWEEPVNVLRSYDMQGNLIETPNQPSIDEHGRYEDWYDLEAASAPVVGFRHDVALKDGATPYEPTHWKLKTGQLPVTDFHWGDQVGGEDIGGTTAVHRVSGWEANVDDDNATVLWDVETVIQ